MMFRRALEAGMKNKFPDINGTLYERIKTAAEQHKLTPDLAAWSHEIRLGGNDAAHDEEPFKKEEAERLSTFTRLVLLYLFTLPGMLDEARGGAQTKPRQRKLPRLRVRLWISIQRLNIHTPSINNYLPHRVAVKLAPGLR